MKTLEQILRIDEQVVWPIAPDSYVDSVVSQLCEKQLGAVLVLEDGNLEGIVCVGDSLRKMPLAKKPFNETQLRRIILRNVIATSPELIAVKCLALTRENSVRHLPIVFDGRFLGIVSMDDLTAVVLKEVQS